MAHVKETYYFSHDCNARNDEKILMLRAEHGWEGYGIFWALIEMMFESTETCIYHNKTKGIAVGYNIDITKLDSVISTAINEGLFVSDGDKFWSESLRKRKKAFHELKKKRSEAGKKGMENRWGNDKKEEEKQNNNSVITEDNKGKESKGKEIKEEVKEHTKKCKDTKKSNTSHSDLITNNPGVPSPYYHLIESFRELPFEDKLPELINIYIQLYPSQIDKAKGVHPARKSAEKVFKRLLENPGCNDATEILKEIAYWEGSVPTPWDIEKKFPKDGQTFADMKYSMDYAWANQEQHVFNVIEGGR